MIHTNISVLENGHLAFGGADTTTLAKKYGTPLYLLDEDRVRENCRRYKDAIEKYFGKESLPLFASKALSVKEIYRIIASEGLGADIVSGGELYTALAADFPADKLYFHGNSKTPEEIGYALESGIGGFVVDNPDELELLSAECKKRNMAQNILLRITPGIDPHTFKAVVTGNVDSKFGLPIETGQAIEFVEKALQYENLVLEGIHCHIGSQIFDYEPFTDAASIMLDFALEVYNRFGIELKKINLGGGIGVRYVSCDPHICVDEMFKSIKQQLDCLIEERNMYQPTFLFELGRYICADAGMTLYNVSGVKEIIGYKKYVLVDGGMGDNPRYALYGSKYTVYNCNKALAERDSIYTVGGRFCESDDLIGEDMVCPRFKKGDLLAVAVTGAYNYSMASNYNKVPRPAMVAISDGADKLIVRRESYEDLIKNEI